MQQPAYELRISDWSSDVCSSDLPCLCSRLGLGGKPRFFGNPRLGGKPCLFSRLRFGGKPRLFGGLGLSGEPRLFGSLGLSGKPRLFGRLRLSGSLRLGGEPRLFGRSEEHTSELQSLMRISYAVFCLKKKNKTQARTNNT